MRDPRVWVCMSLLTLLATVAVGEEPESKYMTSAMLFQHCTGDENDAEEALWKGYCYGYLFGHYMAVTSSPTPFYCFSHVTAEQLRQAYIVWYVEKGKDLVTVETPPALLWGVWLDARFCIVDRARYEKALDNEREMLDNPADEEEVH